LRAPKTTTLTRFSWDHAAGAGYEIHMGRTERHGEGPWLRLTGRNGADVDLFDGCLAADGRAAGTYMHGLFDEPAVLRKWLDHIGLSGLPVAEASGLAARDVQYDLLAEHLVSHADVDAMIGLMGLSMKGGMS
jgi:adenosylcobyric acid synthase